MLEARYQLDYFKNLDKFNLYYTANYTLDKLSLNNSKFIQQFQHKKVCKSLNIFLPFQKNLFKLPQKLLLTQNLGLYLILTLN